MAAANTLKRLFPGLPRKSCASAANSPTHVHRVTVSWRSALDTLRRDTLAHLMTVSEGESLCRLSGDRVNAAKYWEGQAAYLGVLSQEASRNHLDSESPPGPEVFWRVERRQPRPPAGEHGLSEDWRSYLAGWADARSRAERLGSPL